MLTVSHEVYSPGVGGGIADVARLIDPRFRQTCGCRQRSVKDAGLVAEAKGATAIGLVMKVSCAGDEKSSVPVKLNDAEVLLVGLACRGVMLGAGADRSTYQVSMFVPMLPA